MGITKGFVQYGIDGQVQEITMEVLHYYLINYMELFVGKEGVSFFNGYMANI